MKQTITKSDKNVKILNTLIINGFYNGYIENEKFELMPNRWPNNHRLIGTLNIDGKFDLKFDYKSPINFIAKFLLAIGILVSIIFLFKGYYILPIIFMISGLFFWINFKLKEKKEINLFVDKFLEYQKVVEYE